MKNKNRKLKFQIFKYMAVIFSIWFILTSFFWEILYYLEEKHGMDFSSKTYILVSIIQILLLVVMNIPFLRFLMNHVDKPVQKIIGSLNKIAEGNYGGKIPAEVKDSLFMPFVSGDKFRSSKNGSGLGLSLAYKIMKKHDGSLRLEENVPGYTKGFVAEF